MSPANYTETGFPLFPLPVVAFPHCRFPLQIFEPRYLDLIKSCMLSDSCFGIVTLKNKKSPIETASPSILPIGTAAKIIDFNQQPNGLLGIVCEVQYKFNVIEALPEKNKLMRANINFLPAEEAVPIADEFDSLVLILDALLNHEFVSQLGYGMTHSAKHLRADASLLGFQLAHLLPFSIDDKYHLLQYNSANERLLQLQVLLEQIRDRLVFN